MTLGRYVHVPARSAPSERPHTQPAHGLHSQPSPTASARGLRPLRGLLHRARSYSGSESVQGAQRAPAGGPPPAPPGLFETPGGPRTPGGRHQPTSTDTLPSARRSRQAGLPSARRATERAHRAEHPAGPPPPSSSTRGVLPVPFPRPLAYGREHAAYPDSLPPPP